MADAGWLQQHIRDVPDFPKRGVVFKDITPLLGSDGAFQATVDFLVAPFEDAEIDRVVGIEARGFVFAAPVAYGLEAGFVPVRKPGKLPWRLESVTYDLEYGTDTLEVHADAISPGERVLIVDDVLATGGTAAATVGLVERLGGVVAGLAFVLELGFLAGRERLVGHDIHSLLVYE